MTCADCYDHYVRGGRDDVVLTIRPTQRQDVDVSVSCDRGWTLIQRRVDGTVDFYRPWKDYKLGFGSRTIPVVVLPCLTNDYRTRSTA